MKQKCISLKVIKIENLNLIAVELNNQQNCNKTSIYDYYYNVDDLFF